MLRVSDPVSHATLLRRFVLARRGTAEVIALRRVSGRAFDIARCSGPTPVRPVKVMIAKIVPYIGIGYVQVRLTLAFGLFIASNLAFDFTISTLARYQMPGDPAGTAHAFALDPAVGPSLPVPRLADLGVIDRRGVPDDAHPASRPRYHLKGNTGAEILPNLWPITVFTLIIAAIAIWYYREKVD